MPTLDVTPILTDPDISDTFSVIRRQETIGPTGRPETTEKVYYGVVGVVTASSPSALDRQTDYDTYTRSIVVVTRFRLQGQTAGGGKPDHIQFLGSRYLVKHVDLYPHFGPGFYQAEASSIEYNDPAAGNDPAEAGAVQFNNPALSGLLGAL